MRLILKLFYLATTLLTLLVIVVPLLVISKAPGVEPQENIDPHKLVELKKIASENNPFKPQRRYANKSVTLSQNAVNQLVQLALMQKKLAIPTQVYLRQDKAVIKNTLKLGSSGFYINVLSEIVSDNGIPILSNLKLGHLEIPGFLMKQLYPYALQQLDSRVPDANLFLSAVRKLEFKPDEVHIVYEWNPALSEGLRNAGRDMVLPANERKRIQNYYNNIAQTSRLALFKTLSLKDVIKSTFQLAQSESKKSNNPVAENKAAIIAIGMAIANIRPRYIFEERQRAAWLYRVSLKKRRDLALHYAISATLSVISNKALTDAIGISKEIDDSRGGSGFSFPDLLADKAGALMGKMAIESPASAKLVQKILANSNLTEDDFMPGYDNLPEAITELQFKKTYIDITHPKYLFVDEELNRRINAAPLFRSQI